MSDALNERVEAVLKRSSFNTDKAIAFITSNLAKESAPFHDELLIEAWKAKIRLHNHGTRCIREPVPKYRKGTTEGAVVETEASKRVHKAYEEQKANFPMVYLLYGSSGVSLFRATCAQIDHAIESHQKQADGNLRQIRFLKDAREVLMKTPKGVFRQCDFPALIDLAHQHGIV